MPFRGARYPTHDRFNATFHFGHVDKVFDSNQPMDIETKTSTSSEPQSQKIRFWDVMSSPGNKSFKFAVPLLRGVSDSITRGDLILYTIIGDRNFYLGPVNTNNVPYNSADHTYDNVKEIITKKSTDTPSGYNKDIPIKTTSKLSKLRNKKMDFIGEVNSDGIHLKEESSLQYSDSIFTDLTLEGRYGNTIRLGARDEFPQLFISNNNKNNTEQMQVGTSNIAMTSIGAISDNFLLNNDYTLSCDAEEKIINIGNDVVFEEVPENRFNYQYGGDALELNNLPKAQIIISSDRIIFDSLDEDITISSNRNINFGANKNFTITNKGFSVFETKNIYIGRQAKNRTQPMVLGEELRNLLIRILRVLADAQALGDMNVPQPLTLFPSIHKAGTLRDEIQNIMTDFRLGELIPGENPPSPNPSTLLNVEQDNKGNPVPTGDRITDQASFLSQYHFIEENTRPDPQAETQE